MVVDYKQGRIYKIVAPCGLTYYGSTTKRIMDRMVDHKSRVKCNSPKACAAKKVIEAGGEIFLVEMYPCNSEKELRAREGWYQRFKPCVNNRVECRTKKQYRFDNIVKIKSYQKQYRADNTEKIKDKNTRYYQINKQELRRKQNEKFQCPCGGKYTHVHKARHFRTKKHQRWVELNQ